MFEIKDDRLLKVLLVIVVVLIITIIMVMLYVNSNSQELNEINESNQEFNDTVNRKIDSILRKPAPKLECPEIPECPKLEPQKCPEVKIPPCPKCPEFKNSKGEINIPPQTCPQCPDCPVCPTCPSIDNLRPLLSQEQKVCPPQKECPAQRVCPKPPPCPLPRTCPPSRVIQKPCPRPPTYKTINEVMTGNITERESVNTGNMFPFSELKEMCPIRSSKTKSRLSYSPFSTKKEPESDDEEVGTELGMGEILQPRGIQTEEEEDILQQPLINADFTGEGSIEEVEEPEELEEPEEPEEPEEDEEVEDPVDVTADVVMAEQQATDAITTATDAIATVPPTPGDATQPAGAGGEIVALL